MYRGKRKKIKEDKLGAILQAVSYKNIKINVDNTLISFAHKDTKIDLGTVVKGYAVDKAMELFYASGITNACINYGSMSRMLNAPAGKDARKVRVPHPTNKDVIIGAFRLVNQGIAFVGDYSRYPTVQDKSYIHLVDPKTGRPAGNETLAAIATATTAEEAGVLATVLFLKGTEDREKLATVFPNTEWLLLSDKPQNGIVFQGSPGLMKKFKKGEEKIFKLGKGSGCPFSL